MISAGPVALQRALPAIMPTQPREQPMTRFILGIAVAALVHTAPFPFVLDVTDRTIWRMPQGAPPTIYLTFDDGPNPAATPQLLDTLDRHNVRATFFIIDKHLTSDTAPIGSGGGAGTAPSAAPAPSSGCASTPSGVPSRYTAGCCPVAGNVVLSHAAAAGYHSLLYPANAIGAVTTSK